MKYFRLLVQKPDILLNDRQICSVLNEFITGSAHRLVMLRYRRILTEKQFPRSEAFTFFTMNKENYQKELAQNIIPKPLQNKNRDELTEKITKDIQRFTTKICGRVRNQKAAKFKL